MLDLIEIFRYVYKRKSRSLIAVKPRTNVFSVRSEDQTSKAFLKAKKNRSAVHPHFRSSAPLLLVNDYRR